MLHYVLIVISTPVLERATGQGTHKADEGGAYTLGVKFSASIEPSTTTFEASEDFYEQIRV